MQPVIAFPALAGTSYPRLDGRGLRRIAEDSAAIIALPEEERAAIRVLMTSASRGCSAELAAALPNLALVVSQGAGQDKLTLQDLAARGIRVRSIGEAVTEDVADHAMMLIHALCRNLLAADRFARDGSWENSRFDLGESVVGKTLGIAGLSGRIGQAIAARAKAAHMLIAGLERPSNRQFGVPLFADCRALAEACDILVLAVPGTPDLHHMIDAGVLAALGPKGRLVNVGRGTLVDTDALIAALEGGVIAGAALDVLETEPSVPARLAALPNVVLTPHIAAQTWGQRARAAKIAEDEVLAFLDTTNA
ncbi:glyoxylate reductase [Paracoccus pantotrophus]|uniref:Glyoxylate reductase n=1 Tax=Paracoccus pantotrophus TaxID=82367 RepID=A0A7H9BQN7_PARPN|nr:NAD(P)-dependent oxidoreductase [Paracoccus pantotrophus]QLH13038.1 glyoxylate reductase [Paracoccus pantotrophus]